eukprot:scaffold2501_cov113-Isochrysis_galbana.AAC.8
MHRVRRVEPRHHKRQQEEHQKLKRSLEEVANLLRKELIAKVHAHTPRAHDGQEPTGYRVEAQPQRQAARPPPADADGQHAQDKRKRNVHNVLGGEQEGERNRQQYEGPNACLSGALMCRQEQCRKPAKRVQGHGCVGLRLGPTGATAARCASCPFLSQGGPNLGHVPRVGRCGTTNVTGDNRGHADGRLPLLSN